MATALAVVWFATAIGGAVAAVLAVLLPDRRRGLLLVAAACFAVAGVLGILSIGIVFVVGAVVCWHLANRVTPDGATVSV